MQQSKDHERTETVCSRSKDHEDELAELSFVSQNLETIMQKLRQQVAALTVAFIFLGILFFHSIVQPIIPLRRKWWIPFSLFSSVSVIYWYTIKIIIRDYNLVRQEFGLTLDLVHEASSRSAGNHQMTRRDRRWFVSILILFRQNRYMGVFVLALMAFTSLILYACYSLLHEEMS